ncbi:hypothetical protein L2E82_49706 [Cichorium intybus]|uniref:Uncharacterized protein n=1 Tax=Cichorium intybus TaxID=13427 RepID=A0ACB8Z2A4_CICIN|nr:hypothetical protein L2E82_49706 [Cichorium intybus]
MLTFANLPLTFYAEAIATAFAYRVLNKRTRVIEESFDIEFDDQYQWRKKNQDILYVMENDIPVGHRPIHTVEIDYDLLFDALVTAKDAEVIHSPDALQQIISTSGPFTSSEPLSFDNQIESLINTSESRLPTHVDGIPQSEGDHPHSEDTPSADVPSEDAQFNSSDAAINNSTVFIFEADENTFVEESQIQNTSPEDTHFIQDVPLLFLTQLFFQDYINGLGVTLRIKS